MHLKTLTLLATATLPALTISACLGPPVNEPTLDLLKSFEKMHPNPYDDGFKNPTIGYGHLCQDPGCTDVPFPKPLSEESATGLLARDLTVPPPSSQSLISDKKVSPWLIWLFVRCVCVKRPPRTPSPTPLPTPLPSTTTNTAPSSPGPSTSVRAIWPPRISSRI